MRPRHPSKEVEGAVKEAENKGWTLVLSNGHAWAIMRCRHKARGGCQVSVWSTPRDPANEAKRVRRAISKCPH